MVENGKFQRKSEWVQIFLNINLSLLAGSRVLIRNLNLCKFFFYKTVNEMALIVYFKTLSPRFLKKLRRTETMYRPALLDICITVERTCLVYLKLINCLL